MRPGPELEFIIPVECGRGRVPDILDCKDPFPRPVTESGVLIDFQGPASAIFQDGVKEQRLSETLCLGHRDLFVGSLADCRPCAPSGLPQH